MKFFIVLIGLLGFAISSPVAEHSETELEKKENNAIEKRDDYGCYTQNRGYFRHGDTYNNGQRCVNYRCEYGNFIPLQEDCEFQGQCYSANQQFQHKCRTYQCQISHLGNGAKMAQVVPVSQHMCEDVYGQCRYPGDWFSYNLRGILKRRCTCQIASSTITYICYD